MPAVPPCASAVSIPARARLASFAYVDNVFPDIDVAWLNHHVAATAVQRPPRVVCQLNFLFEQTKKNKRILDWEEDRSATCPSLTLGAAMLCPAAVEMLGSAPLLLVIALF